MARNNFDDQGGQTGSAGEGQMTILQADGHESISLPQGDFLTQGDIVRDGQDLVLHGSDGQEVIIENYFSADTPPTLVTSQGSQLTPALVESFVKTEDHSEYAANETANDESAIGLVKEVSGDATVTHPDGSSEKITLGTEIYQGDIIETSAEGAVNIVFVDESSFAVSNNARLAIDEYVFDPASQSGETNVSILRGMFVFTSGLIGRDDPDDVQIDTPVGSIGIRGTTIAGHINPDGESQITVVEGAIVIRNGVTEVTLSDQYDTVTLTGYENQINMNGQMTTDQMRASYGDIGQVNPGFFNTLNETNGSIEGTINQDAVPQEQPAQDASPEPALPDEPVPAIDETKVLQEAQEQTVANYDIFSDPNVTGFDDSIKLTSDPYSTEQNRDIVGGTLLGVTAPLTQTTTTVTGTTTTTTRTATTTALEPPPLPPLELVLEVFVDDDALEGAVVGRVYTTIAYESASIKFITVPENGGGDPYFILVKEASGVYKIVLTAAGEADLASFSLGELIGTVEVGVRLADGRTDTAKVEAVYDDYSSPVSGGPPSSLNLDTMNASQGTWTPGSTGYGLGYHAAYLGDFDHNGSNNFAVTTNIAASGVVNLPGAGNNLNPTNDSGSLVVAGSGDVNGDGHTDILVGRPLFDITANEGQVNLHSGANVFSFSTTGGGNVNDNFGYQVAMIDFNGDGYADIFATAKQFDGDRGNLSWHQGSSSFAFSGIGFTQLTDGAAGEYFGSTMTALRDFNNDGYGDLAVGSVGPSAYVNIYYGADTANGTADVAITGINNSTGQMSIYSVGDTNGDGRTDLLIDNSYATNNLFLIRGGNTGGAIGTIEDLRITSGNTIVGSGSAGDFNGDGYDDIFVAARNGNVVDAFVIYGSPSLTGTIALDPNWVTNNPGRGYHLTFDLANYGSPSGFSMEATSIGDQNGDGFEDMILSSPDFNGTDGGYFIVYGAPDPSNIAAPDPEVHTDVGSYANAGSDMITSSNNDGLVGGTANNIMANLNGGTRHQGVSFQAGNGDDLIRLYGTGSNMARVIDGGNGANDRLLLMDTGTLDLRNVSEFSGVERIMMNAAGTQSMTIGLDDIFELMETSQYTNAGRYTLLIGENGVGVKNLTIDDPSNTTSMSGAGLVAASSTVIDSQTYNIYNFGSGYQLLIDADIGITVN